MYELSSCVTDCIIEQLCLGMRSRDFFALSVSSSLFRQRRETEDSKKQVIICCTHICFRMGGITPHKGPFVSPNGKGRLDNSSAKVLTLQAKHYALSDESDLRIFYYFFYFCEKIKCSTTYISIGISSYNTSIYCIALFIIIYLLTSMIHVFKQL